MRSFTGAVDAYVRNMPGTVGLSSSARIARYDSGINSRQGRSGRRSDLLIVAK